MYAHFYNDTRKYQKNTRPVTLTISFAAAGDGATASLSNTSSADVGVGVASAGKLVTLALPPPSLLPNEGGFVDRGHGFSNLSASAHTEGR